MNERAKILLVDDHDENLLALEAVLSSLDQVLVSVSSGEKALRALLKDEFALILLDAQMPGMDGFETAAQIKSRPRTRDIPIIFLTAVDADHRNAYRGYAAGGAVYLSKPFDPWVLRAKVQVFVDLWKAGRRLDTQASLLRGRVGGTEQGVDVLGELGRRLSDLEESVQALAEPADEASGAEAVDRVLRRTRALRQALDALEEGTTVSGRTRREFG